MLEQQGTPELASAELPQEQHRQPLGHQGPHKTPIALQMTCKCSGKQVWW